MADEPPNLPLYQVPYVRLFPWLRLFRAPGGAADPKRLMLAALGLLLLHAGWTSLDRLFPASARVTPAVLAPRPTVPVEPLGVGSVLTRLAEPVRVITAPFVVLLNPRAGAWPSTHAALAALWAVAVWGLIGGAVARVAVVALAKGERIGLREVLRFSARKAGPLVGTPMVPVLGVVAVAVPVAAFGLLYRLPGAAGGAVAGILAFLPLVGGLVLTLIVIGLAAGWPLMPASVAAEDEDSFDAMSRSYAYVRQRPWHYAAYAALAAAIGAVGLAFVDVFASLVVHLTAWALAFVKPDHPFLVLNNAAPDPGLSALDAVTHRFWLGLIGLLVQAWVYSYFWTAAAAIYLLLRWDVDGTPFNAVAHEAPPSLLAEAAAEDEPPSAPTSPSVQVRGDAAHQNSGQWAVGSGQ
jgi:hypothetical protein